MDLGFEEAYLYSFPETDDSFSEGDAQRKATPPQRAKPERKGDRKSRIAQKGVDEMRRDGQNNRKQRKQGTTKQRAATGSKETLRRKVAEKEPELNEQLKYEDEPSQQKQESLSDTKSEVVKPEIKNTSEREKEHSHGPSLLPPPPDTEQRQGPILLPPPPGKDTSGHNGGEGPEEEGSGSPKQSSKTTPSTLISSLHTSGLKSPKPQKNSHNGSNSKSREHSSCGDKPSARDGSEWSVLSLSEGLETEGA